MSRVRTSVTAPREAFCHHVAHSYEKPMDIFRIRRSLLASALAMPLCGIAPGAIAQGARMKRAIPRTGETICTVGLGTWQVFDVAGDAAARAQAREALKTYAELGGEMVDSSPMYGSSETVTGDLAAELGLHKRLFVATKVWTQGREAGIAQMRDSVKKLRTTLKGPLDLMQVHNLVDTATHMTTLRGWKKEGLVRYIGVTHYHAGAHADLEKAIRSADVDFLQVNYSLAEPQADQRLLAAAAESGVAVIINRPFAEGAMFGRVKGKPLPPFAADIGATSWAQLFLKWIIAHPAVTCVIPGTRNAAHVKDNLGAATGTLPDASLRRRIAEHFKSL
jgi:aryl-alcohol dehydrogenase-like predicted oxidoreductase